jgi:hypothetical protein
VSEFAAMLGKLGSIKLTTDALLVAISNGHAEAQAFFVQIMTCDALSREDRGYMASAVKEMGDLCLAVV